MKKGLLIILSSLCLIVTGCVSIATAEEAAVDMPQKSGFNFIFKYGVTGGNTLDTFHGTFTKDMITAPGITTELTLTADEMDSIYLKMVEIDFFNYPEEFKVTVPEGELTRLVTPYSSYYFTVEKDAIVKELKWEDEIMNPDVKADRLRELISLIRDIIESRPEYQVLPAPSGGYM